MVQQLVTLTDGSGNRWRVDRDVMLPLLEQHHVPLPPCPDGWSRLDYMYGADEDCAVPVLLREVGIWLSVVTCGPYVLFLMGRQWRYYKRGQTHKPLFHATSFALAAFVSHFLWAVSCAANFSLWWAWIFVTGFGFFGVETMVFTSLAFLNNAIDTMHALEPARGAVWRGRLAVAFDFLRPCHFVANIWGACRWGIQHLHTGEFVRAGGANVLAVNMGAGIVMFFLTSVSMFLGAFGTARTARALGASAETQQLRRRLRRQSHNATTHAILYFSIFFVILLVVVFGQRVVGICWSLLYGIVPGILLFRLAMRNVRGSGRKRVDRILAAGRSPARIAPERRISALEDAAVAPATIAPPHVPLTRRGVSLAFLRAFAEQKRVGARMSTADVCDRVVKPATVAAGCAYYDLLCKQDTTITAQATSAATSAVPTTKSSPLDGSGQWASCRNHPLALEQPCEHWAGEASYFLSHSWSYRFRELLAILESFEEQAKPEHTVYYWFDIFVMNQHSPVDMHALFPNLQASVRSAGRLLLAVDSWREPAPLARVWCLLEIFTAISQKAELVLCFSSAEQASFTERLVQNHVEVQRTLEAVDAEKAEATVAADREMIFELIRRGTGFRDFNDTIRLALRHSFERVVIAQRKL